jgi:hypothetical protein
VSRVRLVSLLPMLCVALLPWAPVPHVHDHDAGGHHDLLAHSHLEAHHSHEHAGRHDGIAFDDEDSVVLTLDPVFALPDDVPTVAPPASATTLLIEPAMITPLAPAPVVEQLAHSPPRAPAIPRGPPATSLL